MPQPRRAPQPLQPDEIPPPRPRAGSAREQRAAERAARIEELEREAPSGFPKTDPDFERLMKGEVRREEGDPDFERLMKEDVKIFRDRSSIRLPPPFPGPKAIPPRPLPQPKSGQAPPQTRPADPVLVEQPQPPRGVEVPKTLPQPLPAPPPPPLPPAAEFPVPTPSLPKGLPAPGTQPGRQPTSPQPGALAAIGALAGLAAIALRSQTVTPARVREPRRLELPESQTQPVPQPQPEPLPTPVPTPPPLPGLPPLPLQEPRPQPAPLTQTNQLRVQCSPCTVESLKEAKEQRKRQREAKCKAFIKVPVRAHKKSVCVQDLAKYLFRKFKSKAGRAVRAELKKHGIEMMRRPRKPKLPDIELGGGIEIDTGDLLGK